MTDHTARDLIQRLSDALAAHSRYWLLINEARAYLAAPDGPAVPDGREPASVECQPSDAELLELMPEAMRDEFSYAATICSDATGSRVKPGIFRVALNTAALEYARAVLARWGGR